MGGTLHPMVLCADLTACLFCRRAASTSNCSIDGEVGGVGGEGLAEIHNHLLGLLGIEHEVAVSSQPGLPVPECKLSHLCGLFIKIFLMLGSAVRRHQQCTKHTVHGASQCSRIWWRMLCCWSWCSLAFWSSRTQFHIQEGVQPVWTLVDDSVKCRAVQFRSSRLMSPCFLCERGPSRSGGDRDGVSCGLVLPVCIPVASLQLHWCIRCVITSLMKHFMVMGECNWVVIIETGFYTGLCTKIIENVLRHGGTLAWDNEMWKLSYKTLDGLEAQSLRTLPGILSGPGAFQGLILSSIFLTCAVDQRGLMVLEALSGCKRHSVSGSFGSFQHCAALFL